MIKTIPLDMFVSFGIGLLLSIAAHKSPRGQESVFKTKAFKWALAYQVVFATGVAFIAYMIEPDWMLMYGLDRFALPLHTRAVAIIFAFSFYIWVFILAYLAVPELDKYRPGLALKVYYGVNVAILVVCLVFVDRLWHVGTLSEYMNDQAQGLVMLSPFKIHYIAWLLAAATPIVLASLIWVYRKISNEALGQQV